MAPYAKNLVLLTVFITYTAYAMLSLSETAKASRFYYLGLGLPILGNWLWLVMTKSLDSRESVAYGGSWDLIVSLSFPMAALLLMGTNFTFSQYLGIALFVLGGIAFRY